MTPADHPDAAPGPGGAAADARAQRRHWDRDAARYLTEHGDYLETFHWCPERLTEDEARLLGDPADLRGRTVVEIGCGSAPCGAWVARHGAFVVGIDISREMLAHAPAVDGLAPVQADAARLPLRDACADIVFSSFGAFPFIGGLDDALREVRRVLRPGGRVVVAANHPMAWVFPDDPGELGLLACVPYHQRAYEERAADGTLEYVEYHHTVGDWVRGFAAAGLTLLDVVEPRWPEGTPEWGQWSPLRGAVFPGTAVWVAQG
ncbi:class I SAM-dependent methyltransferase [Corynebacterium bovis]|uniref:class I SAM-dependent methyltransferase n=1 Tax=Corynebacterium bovis TaxID=36808 RepID=UPI000F636FF7|nr:class I SAM-dependent methyltransferase [Corynebacterium bovis]MDN8578416.1 class I SAM-dependent methyltransferase [Corynebacterium bovis]RRO90328.1 class I SAM-dependent methyltransferase [Corynebacterium bovis]